MIGKIGKIGTSFAFGNKIARDQTTPLIGKGDLCLRSPHRKHFFRFTLGTPVLRTYDSRDRRELLIERETIDFCGYGEW